MKRINVSLSTKYDIIIENSSLSKLEEYIKEVYTGQNIYIITDERVASLYLEQVRNSLKSYNVHECVIEGYEKAKSLETYHEVVSLLIKKGLRRKELLIALGGGVIGDLTGFIAGTLYRGLDFIQIPTTILAQNDSSIGGKTAINIPEGKNLIGVFKQPLMVIIDPLTINTLPKEEVACGMAEVIKHALIHDETLVLMLLNKDSYDHILYRSIKVKQAVVEEDEFDTGIRMILNFGHTFGHVLEKEGNFSKYSHGQAVAYGMLMALRLGEYYGITNKKLHPLLVSMLEKYDLDTYEFPIKDYLSKIIYDKKNIGGVINFIALEEIGKTKVIKINEDSLKELGDKFENNPK